MGLKTESIGYGAGSHSGYFCYPERAALPLPAVVVVQEVWGVDSHIEDVTRRFALAGYAALAPDLYAQRGTRAPALGTERLAELQTLANAGPTLWRDPVARDAELARRPEAERKRIAETFAEVSARLSNLASYVPSLVAATHWLRQECSVTRGQRIGSVGFCMGGGLSALLAAHDPELCAAVIFYGGAPPAEIIPQIGCPLLGFYGALDDRVTGQVPALEEAMKQSGKRFEKAVYAGAPHAFFNDARPTYDVRASRDAFARTLAFFRAELGA